MDGGYSRLILERVNDYWALGPFGLGQGFGVRDLGCSGIPFKPTKTHFFVGFDSKPQYRIYRDHTKQ